MRKIYYRDAILEALDEEMARDDMVMMIGEDIGIGDGTWRCSKGLRDKYGDLRMKDSPISEAGFTGMCIGMALTGMRPIAEIMFEDFMLVAMDQIVNQMNKVCYVRRPEEPSHGYPYHHWGRESGRRAAFAESHGGGRPFSGSEDRDRFRRLYRQRSVKKRNQG